MLKPFIPDDKEIKSIIYSSNQVDSDDRCKVCQKYKPALYYVGDNQVMTGCPYCLSIKLSRLFSFRRELPIEIIKLLDEAKNEVIIQNEKILKELDVFPEKTFTCSNCKSIVPRSQVCFIFTKKSDSSYLYCKGCHELLYNDADKLIFDGLTPIWIDYEIGKAFIDK